MDEYISKKKIRGEWSKKYNEYKICDSVTVMYTIKREPFLIDTEDLPKVKDICWRKKHNGYLIGWNKFKDINLHRLVMNCPDNMIVDHINGDVSDNRKQNLRIVTQSQNHMNACKRKNNKSGTTGVSWCERDKCWRAQIRKNGKVYSLGSYRNIDDAIAARKLAEQELFGCYSYDNSRARMDLKDGDSE